MSRRLSALLCLSALGLLQPLHGEDTKATSSPPRLVVSGFEPFGGRDVNASYVLAQAIEKSHPPFKAVQVPVIWGAPLEAWKAHGASAQFWLAFGEGTSVFQIETTARNQRGPFPDNTQSTPGTPLTAKDGPATLDSALPAEALASALRARGFPVRVSTNAGQYLCEEMLYTLLLQEKKPGAQVMFVHVPVLDASVILPDGTTRKATAEWLAKFGDALIQELNAQRLIAPQP